MRDGRVTSWHGISAAAATAQEAVPLGLERPGSPRGQLVGQVDRPAATPPAWSARASAESEAARRLAGRRGVEQSRVVGARPSAQRRANSATSVCPSSFHALSCRTSDGGRSSRSARRSGPEREDLAATLQDSEMLASRARGSWLFVGCQPHCRPIATRSRSSGVMRWSASSASSPRSIWTQLTVPVKTLLSPS